MNIHKYRKQKYFACQLIAAINARIFLGGDDVTDEQFEELVDLTLCRNGSALKVGLAYPILGLDYEDGPRKFNKKWVMNNLPCQLDIWDIKCGFHVILVDKVDKHGARVINLFRDIFLNYLSWSELERLYNRSNYSNRPSKCRSFKITNLMS